MKRALLRAVARCWPLSVSPDSDLRRAVAFLGWGVDAETVVGASYAATVALALVGVLGQTVLGGSVGLAVAGCCLVCAAVVLATTKLVVAFASVRRAEALGDAPALVTRLTMRLSLTPAPGAAAAFGARSVPGALADSLASHVRRTANGPNTGLQAFGREWKPWLPELERACSLVESAGREPAQQRGATLERARTTVLDGIHDRTAAFAASISGPATALYAFGVLLPLALVALLPALDAAGVPAPLSLLVVVYDVLLPLAVTLASAWLLTKRPVAFRPTPIRRSHPDVWSRPTHAAVAGIAAALLAGWSVRLVLSDWMGFVAAAGAGLGTALVVAFQPMQSVRSTVEAVEAGLPDALSLIGRRVTRGTATERAVEDAATAVPGATGTVLAEVAGRQRRLGVDLRTAFVGERGALATVPSERAESAASLLALSAREGRPAGDALLAMADHLQTIDEAEQANRRAVAQVTNTLSNTAAVFAPLVGGATVALSAAMGSAGPLGGSVATADLGLAVGWYVLVLAIVLTTLATGLTDGLDRSLVGYRVGLALLAATATYLTAFVGATSLV